MREDEVGRFMTTKLKVESAGGVYGARKNEHCPMQNTCKVFRRNESSEVPHFGSRMCRDFLLQVPIYVFLNLPAWWTMLSLYPYATNA